MEKPSGSEGSSSPEKFSPFSPTGLHMDYFNAWMRLSASRDMVDDPSVFGDKLEVAKERMLKRIAEVPISTYEDYGRKTWGNRADKSIEASNAESIARINELAAEFNATREGLIEKQDLAKIKEYFKRAYKIIYGAELPGNR